MALRTAAEFDDWFRRSAGGDPWNYSSETVQRCLDVSLEFLSQHLPADFGGTFFEMAAFRGEFTRRLAMKFARALVVASDISAFAIEAAKTVCADLQNVRLLQADIATFLPPPNAPRPYVLLLLECIYYLPPDERGAVLAKLVSDISPPTVFISCPVTGDPYPTPNQLRAWFGSVHYRETYTQTLSIRAVGNQHLPNQVLYRFVPI